jgi:Tol biopolymer transport system component
MRIGLTIFFLLLSAPLIAQTTERVSFTHLGLESTGPSFSSTLSADGNSFAFLGDGADWVPNDNNGQRDAFVRNIQTGVVTRVSVSSAGVEGDGYTSEVVISADGKWVAFISESNNIVPGDPLWYRDVFLHELSSGLTTRVSVDAFGVAGDASSEGVAISADGRYLVFHSKATNLVPGDTNGVKDVFLYDRIAGSIERISNGLLGMEADGLSEEPNIGLDGRFITYTSRATNLVANDTDGLPNAFLLDRLSGETTFISVSSTGVLGDGEAGPISADARFVVFRSGASNLIPGGSVGSQVFLRDLQLGETTLVSKDSNGVHSIGIDLEPWVSTSGRFVMFQSWADNLVVGDNNDRPDVFLHDRETELTTMIDVNNLGGFANNGSYKPTISSNGRYILFDSRGSNLVPNDTNGRLDVFLRDLAETAETNHILLWGPYQAPTGAPVELTWCAAPANAPYYLHYSLNLNGTMFGGHRFDIGSPATLLATGLTTVDGQGSFISQNVPPAAAGFTVYFEQVVRSGGKFYESIVQPIQFY